MGRRLLSLWMDCRINLSLASTTKSFLRDIGTDEALDRLVLLLKDTDLFIRQQAGYVLAEMITSRNLELKQRAMLLSEQKDTSTWPLEAYFPGRLAIPIAQSLVEAGPSANEAINCAINAIRAKQYPEKPIDQTLLRQWQNLRRDLSFRDFSLRTQRSLQRTALAGLVILILSIIIPIVIAGFQSNIIVFDCKTLIAYSIDTSFVQKVNETAKALTEEIEDSYPPNASGWARVWPWNWQVEPLLPEDKAKAFVYIKTLSYLGGTVDQNLYNLVDLNKNKILFDATKKSAALCLTLNQAIKDLSNQLPLIADDPILIYLRRIYAFFLGVLLAFL